MVCCASIGRCCSSICSFFFGCCGHNKTHDPKGTTLVEERTCTDKLMLILIIIACIGSGIVISMASTLGGNPQKIIKGIDLNGDICGYSNATLHAPYAALVNPLTSDPIALQVWICLPTCDMTANYTNSYMTNLYSSTAFYGYCVPTFGFNATTPSGGTANSQFQAQFDGYQSQISRGVADLGNAWQIILLSLATSLFFSYVYMWLTNKFAKIIIWMCIILVAVAGFFVGYAFLTAAASAPTGTDPDRIKAYTYAGYVFIALTALFVLIILGLSSQIAVAIEVVKEGSKAVNDMKLLVFFPLIPLALCMGYMVYWIYGALFIFSVSTLVSQPIPSACYTRDYASWAYYGGLNGAALGGTTNSLPANFSTFIVGTSYRPLAAYHVFHGLWITQFLVYLCYFVIAGSVCGWYFTISDANDEKILGGKDGGSYIPITRSVLRTLRYHLGTIAFASLIIAIINFIRIVVKYIELKTRSNPPSHLQKAIFCIIQCCLKCVECWYVDERGMERGRGGKGGRQREMSGR
jgi:multisubunit Na+/H+ antiporter MnhC subunit